MRFIVYGCVAVVAMAAGTVSALAILHEGGWRSSTVGRLYGEWMLDSDKRAEAAYAEFLSGDRAAAARLFREAVSLDPASPYRWCDYGESLLSVGDMAGARRAMARAVELGPHVGPILMRAANFAYSTSDKKASLEYGSRLLAQTEVYDDAIFGNWARMKVPAEEILRDGVPNGAAGKTYLSRAMAGHSVADADEAWEWLDARGFADGPTRDAYLRFLLGSHRYDAAAEVWTRFARLHEAGYPERNLIYNGRFERDPGSTVFDWRWTDGPGVRVERVTSGASGLRLTFDGTENVALGNVAQQLFVREGSYTFEAKMRTSELSTDEGILFRVFDPEAAQRVDVRTESVGGTTGLSPVRATVNVPRGTRLLEVQVVRKPSLKFDNKIRGTAWIEAVRLHAR